MKLLITSIFVFIFSLFSSSISDELKQKVIYSKKEIIVQLESKSVESELLSDFPNSRKILLNFYSVKVPDGKEPDQFIKEIQKKGYIKYADFNYGYKLTSIPNDPLFYYQWGLRKIKAPEAWNIATGSNDVYVAVIDDGVDFAHPDLENNIWRNPGEICNNGKDDDKNGYIDDCYGWNAVKGKGSAVPKGNHGTHVAGIIGAVGNNGIGVSGVNWNVQIVPCGAVSDDGYLYDIDIAECFGYIQKLKYINGVDIVAINASWGGYGHSKLAKKVLDIIAQYDILLVTAAGNEWWNNDSDGLYPCAYESDTIICVGASNENDEKAWFSNYGIKTVDLFAPGTNILSTVTYYTVDYGFYDTFDGTSMATPFVSGAVALAKSLFPNLNYKELKKKVIASGDDINKLHNYCISGKRLNLENIVNGNSVASYLIRNPVINFGFSDIAKEKTQVISITSVGEIPLLINSFELTNDEDFYIKSENCTGKSLDFYEKCKITIAFKPLSGDKKYTSSLILHSNAINNEKISLIGYAKVNPILSADPKVVVFKNTNVGESSNPKQIVLKNIGTGNLTINNINSLNNSDFIYDFSGCPDLPFKLKQNESCSISVKYSPTKEGEISTYLLISYNDGSKDLTKSISIYGTTEKLPDLQLNKTDFYFEAPVGEYSKAEIVKIYNKGKADLNISYIGANYGEFVFDFKSGDKPCMSKVVTIQPNEYCTFSIKFKPNNNFYQEIFSYLKIVSNDTFYKDYFVGKLYGKPLNVEVDVTPNEINFGEYQVDDKSEFKIITIKNVSKINVDLKIKNINLKNNSDFSLDLGSCGTLPFTLKQNEYCKLKIRFNPKSTGTKKADLIISSNDYENSNVYVRLKGKGLKKSPAVSVSPKNLNFGNIQVGKISNEKIVSLKNDGMLPLEIYSIETKSKAFLINYSSGSKPCGSKNFVIQPKESCTIGIRFSPNEEDDFEEEIKIKSNIKTTEISVYGNGTRGIPPKIIVSTENMDFGKVVVAQTKKREITIKNPTNKSKAIITDIKLSDRQNFAIDYKSCGSSSFVLPENSSCKIEVSFIPSRDKRFKTYLEIYSNDPEDEKIKVKIYGEGVKVPPSKMEISFEDLDFGAVRIGNEKIKEIKIRNTGENNLNIYEIRLKNGVFHILTDYGEKPCNTLTPTIQPADFCTIGIKFKPDRDKSFKSKLEIESNDSYSNKHKIYLYGKGTEIPEGYLNVEKEELNFGAVGIGDEKLKELKIYNLGESNLKVEEINLESSEFNILVNYGTKPCNTLTPTIQPDNFCTIGIKFKPDRDKKFKSTLEIKSENDKEKIKLYGKGTIDKQPFIIVNETEINFDDTLINDSLIKEFKLTNIGNGDLKIYRMKTSDSKAFQLVSNYGSKPCNTLTPTIKPDKFCTVGIKFKPYKEKRFKSKLEIKSNDETIKISVYGEGWEQFPPKIDVEPRKYDFGIVKVGYGQPSKIVKIKNNGKGILNITSIKNKDSNFILNFNKGDKPCNVSTPSISPNSYCTFEVVFNPVSKGKKKTKIEIRSNDKEDNKMKLYFEGEAIPAYGRISVSPFSIHFSEYEVILIGYSSDPEKITIKNSGQDRLVIKEIELTDDKNFIIDPNLGNDKPCGSLTPIIEPDDYCTIHLIFRPVEKVSSVKNCENGFCETKVTAKVRFVSNDEDGYEPEIKIYADSAKINGKRYLYVNPKVYDFEFTDVGQISNPVEIKLENHNESEIEIEEIIHKKLDEFSVDYNGGSKPCGSFPVKIGINDYCTITAYFKPNSEGFKKANLRVVGSYPYKIDEEIVLTGRTTKDEPYMRIQPRYIDFEENFVKTLSEIKEVKITNSGSKILVINEIYENSEYLYIKLNDGEKPCGDKFPINLSPDEYCTFTVVYQPHTEDRKDKTITIKSNDPYNSKYSIIVTGTGVLPPYPPGGCSLSLVNREIPLYLLIPLLFVVRRYLINRKV